MTSIFTSIRAVAFDLDGTLVDSIQDLAIAANAMRTQMGYMPLSEELVRSFVGDGIGALVHRTLTGQVNGIASETEWEQGFQLFVTYYAKHIATHTYPYPHVEDTLALLKMRHYALAVITNKNERFARQILCELKLMDYFSILIGGDTLPEKKPHPLPLIHVAHALNIQPEELLMVGDSRNDILAAKHSGSLVVGVDYGYANMHSLQQNEATQANLVISDIAQLLDYLPQCTS